MIDQRERERERERERRMKRRFITSYFAKNILSTEIVGSLVKYLLLRR
jgi:hypothetical protein